MMYAISSGILFFQGETMARTYDKTQEKLSLCCVAEETAKRDTDRSKKYKEEVPDFHVWDRQDILQHPRFHSCWCKVDVEVIVEMVLERPKSAGFAEKPSVADNVPTLSVGPRAIAFAGRGVAEPEWDDQKESYVNDDVDPKLCISMAVKEDNPLTTDVVFGWREREVFEEE